MLKNTPTTDKTTSLSFFLGSNSKNGFTSFFGELYSDDIKFLHILKGGPGCGKSTFMKKIATFAEEKGYVTERIYCSSDPNSLDSVIIKELGLAFVDGTAPHIMEPIYPAIKQSYLDFSAFWDEKIIQNHSNQAIFLTNKISKKFKNAFELLDAAGKISDLLKSEILDFTNISKIKSRAEGIAKREIPFILSDKKPSKKRFLGANSPEGVVQKCDFSGYKIYKIRDKFGLSSIFMQVIADYAIKQGHEIYECYCPLNPERLEHVIIPSLNLSFITSHKNFAIKGELFRVIHVEKHVDSDFLRTNKQNIKDLQGEINFLVSSACQNISKAKSLHDELENFYIEGMDFAKTDELFKKITENF